MHAGDVSPHALPERERPLIELAASGEFLRASDREPGLGGSPLRRVDLSLVGETLNGQR